MKKYLFFIVDVFFLGAPAAESFAYEEQHLRGQVHYEPFEFSVPAINDYVYFTLFIIPNKQSNMLDLCEMEPVVRDVVNRTLYGQKGLEKLGLKDRHMKNASKILKQRINKKLNADWVYEAIFIRGAIDIGSGPLKNPTVPKPLSCDQIYFKAKSSKGLDDD